MSHSKQKTSKDISQTVLKEEILLYKTLSHKGLFKVSNFQRTLNSFLEEATRRLYLSNLYDLE